MSFFPRALGVLCTTHLLVTRFQRRPIRQLKSPPTTTIVFGSIKGGDLSNFSNSLIVLGHLLFLLFLAAFGAVHYPILARLVCYALLALPRALSYSGSLPDPPLAETTNLSQE